MLSAGENIICYCLTLFTDSIEANIESASVNVVRGSEHIRQARSHLVTFQFTMPRVLAVGCIALSSSSSSSSSSNFLEWPKQLKLLQ